MASTQAQGTITVGNGTYSLARTNETAFGGGVGNTAPVLGSFYYAVFTASSTITSIDASLQDLLTPNWTFTGVYATNSAVASGGRLLNGAFGISTSQGWVPGQTNSYLLLGWSAAIAGKDVVSVENQLRGAVFRNGFWTGGGFETNSNFGPFFIGATAIGFGEAGGGTTGLGPFLLFGTTPTTAGTPISTPFDMYLWICPEPTVSALMALGFAAILISTRRRNSRCDYYSLSRKG